MRATAPIPTEQQARFEVLPFRSSEAEAAQLPRPVRLTVTCSPKHGPERSIEAAGRLHELGHAVTVHIAARMVRDRRHLDALLGSMADAGADDVLLVGGDADPPQGAFASAGELLPLVAVHPNRPRTIGITGYPEGHPLIADQTLDQALREKSRRADYVTTQMCFDPLALRSWIVRHREHGMALPVLVGLPGSIARRRLLEMSARIGVGPSLRFVRKQRGLRSLLSRRSTADRLYEAVAPMVDDPQLSIEGIHYFTFNQLIETWRWQHDKQPASARRPKKPAAPGSYVQPEESTA
jgi:methylenetetrahydrofolate reductase (NADH)